MEDKKDVGMEIGKILVFSRYRINSIDLDIEQLDIEIEIDRVTTRYRDRSIEFTSISSSIDRDNSISRSIVINRNRCSSLYFFFSLPFPLAALHCLSNNALGSCHAISQPPCAQPSPSSPPSYKFKSLKPKKKTIYVSHF